MDDVGKAEEVELFLLDLGNVTGDDVEEIGPDALDLPYEQERVDRTAIRGPEARFRLRARPVVLKTGRRGRGESSVRSE